MFLKVAQQVRKNLFEKKQEVVGNLKTYRQLEQQILGVDRVITVLVKYQNQLLNQGYEENRCETTASTEAIVGRLVLLAQLSHDQKKLRNQRRELRRLNRENNVLRDKMRYDLRTMEDRKARWTILDETSPSGKTLFVCKVCGRVSVTPDKNCRTISDPRESLGCSEWPNHPKQLSVGARMTEAAKALEEVLDDMTSDCVWRKQVEYVLFTLTGRKNSDRWKAADGGARELAQIIEEELVDLSRAPQKREKQIEKLIELCGEVKRGKLAGQAWGGE